MIMIDAAKEEAAAIREIFKNAYILMCWFHMKKNVREPRNAGKPALKPVYDDILHACDYLHYSTTPQIFEQRKYDVLTNWSLPVWAPKVYHCWICNNTKSRGII
jgi:hypothetical protein